MQENLSDTIRRAQRGSQEAFRVLFDHLNAKLFRYAYSHTGDREEAKDLVQETFVDLWRELPKFSYRSEESFYAFIFLILKRKLAKVYESRKRSHDSLDERMEIMGDTDMDLAEVPEYEDHRVLARAIKALSTTSREIIVLRHWSELSFKEIAATLSINESAAKVRHHRAVGELREILLSYGYQ